MVYQTDLNGNVMQLTDGWHDYGSLQMMGNGKQLLVSRHSFLHPDDLYVLTPSKKEKKSEVVKITDENKYFFQQLALPTVQQRWVKTTDGKEELVGLSCHLISMRTRNIPPYYSARVAPKVR